MDPNSGKIVRDLCEVPDEFKDHFMKLSEEDHKQAAVDVLGGRDSAFAQPTTENGRKLLAFAENERKKRRKRKRSKKQAKASRKKNRR